MSETGKRDGFGIGELGSVPEADPVAEAEAQRLQPRLKSKMVKCMCGHWCPVNLVMSASLGTSCPDCYDRMSDC